jgi:uncharacterized membrane protein
LTPPADRHILAPVSSLIAVAYPDRDTAEQVRNEPFELTTGAGAAGGALWGGLIGLIFLAPLLGAATDAALAARSSRPRSTRGGGPPEDSARRGGVSSRA